MLAVHRGATREYVDMQNIQELEERLKSENQRRERAMAALAPKHKGGEWDEYRAADQEVLRLERQLAAANGAEYAEPFDFPFQWDSGVPMPHLMANEHRVLLAFLLSQADPNWEGGYVKSARPSDEAPKPLALVVFERCTSTRLGDPNDEVLDGHPLDGKGLEPYTAQRVINSRWLKEIELINRLHHMYRPESWRDLYHYIFWFHDSTFECIARSYAVETHRTSMRALLGIMVERLIA
jgi:hypothetical protein